MFSPTFPAVLPPGAFGPLIGTGLPGASYVILLEPAGELPDPGELPSPVWIGPDQLDHFVSDVLVNGLANQAGLAPFIALISDNNPDLAALVPLLSPATPFLDETGVLQDLTPLMGPAVLPGFGPVEVQVQSDVSEVPEPGTFALLGFGLLGLGAAGQRGRRLRA